MDRNVKKDSAQNRNLSRGQMKTILRARSRIRRLRLLCVFLVCVILLLVGWMFRAQITAAFSSFFNKKTIVQVETDREAGSDIITGAETDDQSEEGTDDVIIEKNETPESTEDTDITSESAENMNEISENTEDTDETSEGTEDTDKTSESTENTDGTGNPEETLITEELGKEENHVEDSTVP